MNIAIDYDGTYSRDKEMWSSVCQSMINIGHKVFCITKRYKQLGEEIRKNILSEIPIIFVETRYKKQTTLKMRLPIDVWIDDKPESIAPALPIFYGRRKK